MKVNVGKINLLEVQEADDADHSLYSGEEYGKRTAVLDTFQTGLDFAGMAPGIGVFPDVANAGISLLRGDLSGAGMSVVAAVPIIGHGATAAKMAGKIPLSSIKKALREVHEKLGGRLPKGQKGRISGSPQRGTPKKGYRLDPGHPNRPVGHPESGWHINFWDYTRGKRGKGGIKGVIPIK